MMYELWSLTDKNRNHSYSPEYSGIKFLLELLPNSLQVDYASIMLDAKRGKSKAKCMLEILFNSIQFKLGFIR